MTDHNVLPPTDPMKAWSDLQTSWSEALKSMSDRAAEMAKTSITPDGLRKFADQWIDVQKKFVEQGMMLNNLFPSPELADRFHSATKMYLQFYRWWVDTLAAAKQTGGPGGVPEAVTNMWKQAYTMFVEPMMAMPMMSATPEARGMLGIPMQSADAMVEMQRNWTEMLERATRSAVDGIETSGPEVMREFYASWAKGYEMTVGKLVRMPPIGPARQGVELYQKSLDSYLRLCGAAFDFYLRMSKPSLDALVSVSNKAHDVMQGEVTPESFQKLYGLMIREFEKRLQDLFSTDEFVRTLRTTLEASLSFQKDYQAFVEASLKGTPIVTRTEMDEVHEELYLLRRQIKEMTERLKGSGSKAD